jgi:hypothetical protein
VENLVISRDLKTFRPNAVSELGRTRVFCLPARVLSFDLAARYALPIAPNSGPIPRRVANIGAGAARLPTSHRFRPLPWRSPPATWNDPVMAPCHFDSLHPT